MRKIFLVAVFIVSSVVYAADEPDALDAIVLIDVHVSATDQPKATTGFAGAAAAAAIPPAPTGGLPSSPFHKNLLALMTGLDDLPSESPRLPGTSGHQESEPPASGAPSPARSPAGSISTVSSTASAPPSPAVSPAASPSLGSAACGGLLSHGSPAKKQPSMLKASSQHSNPPSPAFLAGAGGAGSALAGTFEGLPPSAHHPNPLASTHRRLTLKPSPRQHHQPTAPAAAPPSSPPTADTAAALEPVFDFRPGPSHQPHPPSAPKFSPAASPMVIAPAAGGLSPAALHATLTVPVKPSALSEPAALPKPKPTSSSLTALSAAAGVQPIPVPPPPHASAVGPAALADAPIPASLANLRSLEDLN